MKVSEVLEGRNFRAHLKHPTEAEAIDALGCMEAVLRRLGLADHLDEITMLFEQAPAVIRTGEPVGAADGGPADGPQLAAALLDQRGAGGGERRWPGPAAE